MCADSGFYVGCHKNCRDSLRYRFSRSEEVGLISSILNHSKNILGINLGGGGVKIGLSLPIGGYRDIYMGESSVGSSTGIFLLSVYRCRIYFPILKEILYLLLLIEIIIQLVGLLSYTHRTLIVL